MQRLTALLGEGNIVVGGETDAADRYIAPTVIDNVSFDHAVMQEEIFGPILPVLTYDDLGEAIEILEARPKPLALYVFSADRARQEQVLSRLSAGGTCINDVFAQFINLRLPFGGVGTSGMGAYHGKAMTAWSKLTLSITVGAM
jgi:aldehyde dehydrogenase (NAD+)